MTNNGNYEDQIAIIIESLFPRAKDLLNNYKSPLTGYPLYLEAYEMVYLFFEIEKKLAIQFGENDLYSYNFLSIERISEQIGNKLDSNLQ